MRVEGGGTREVEVPEDVVLEVQGEGVERCERHGGEVLEVERGSEVESGGEDSGVLKCASSHLILSKS